jgi:multiple sugar transport system ATP-binding protein
MSDIVLRNVSKTYDNGYAAIHNIDLEVREGEFMVVVGPSGCGKSTLLRMVAGLESITDGEISFGGEVINDYTPGERDLAMVFQNYALYPHMTVEKNIGYSLRLRKMPKDEIKRRVEAAAEILSLTEYLKQRPGRLSGGQRQRVAMGRAIVREPRAFLMDEPLSNLDAKLRVQMRSEILQIQRRVGVATLYVTHDQVEAMTMGDRVTVLRAGVLQQCDTAQVLYDRPVNVFVASFVGSPSMNLLYATLDADGSTLRVGSQSITIPDSVFAHRPALKTFAGREVIFGVRPEDFTLDGAGEVLQGRVGHIEALGSELIVHFGMDARNYVVEDKGGSAEEAEELLEATALTEHVRNVARVAPRSQVATGDLVSLHVAMDRAHFFDASSGLSIW